ncbi:ALP1-like protein isoform X1 [Tanacetum coccineum]
MHHHNGSYIMFGDMNAVRNAQERFGTTLNSIEADHFNSFIDSIALVDLSIGGRSFTWMNKAANRLSKVIDKIVSKEQSAFIAGRQILDGPLELLDSHSRQFWIGNKWCSWIKACLNSSRASILINSSPTSEFSIKRGLRQGDPLSPFLFILVIEGLHNAFEEAVGNGLITGVNIKNSTINVSYLFYADDVIITTDWNAKDMDNIIRVLHVFYLASGDIPFNYLGLPIGSNMKSIASWKTLVDRFHMRLSSWKANLLSIEGSSDLIKFCAWLSYENKMAWVKWPIILNSFDKGGLNIGSLKAFNLALLQKWRLEVASSPKPPLGSGHQSLSWSKGGFGTKGCGTRIQFWKDIWVGETPLFTRHVMQLINEDQQMQGESSRRSRKAINRDRDIAEARLMADYFGPSPKYLDYYFRRRYRMNRSLFLEIVQGIENYIETHDPLPAHFKFFVVRPDATDLMGFSVIMKCTSAIRQLAYDTSPDALDEYLQIGEHCARDCANNDLTFLNPFEVNGVTFEKGYYLADGIYPQYEAFVKSFTVARDERNAIFKRRQKSARKDVERAFGVLQGRWHIIAQLVRAWTVNKLRRIMYTCIILHNMILKNQKFALSDIGDTYIFPRANLARSWIERCEVQRKQQ